MGGFERLLEGEGRLGGAVDVEGGRAAGGEDCVWGWREGEDLGWVGWGVCVSAGVLNWSVDVWELEVVEGLEMLEANCWLTLVHRVDG